MHRTPPKLTIIQSESTLIRSRWEPCLGTGVPLLVALDAPQFRLDDGGNVMAVMPIGGSTVTPGDATLRLDALSAVTSPHGDSATPRKRCLAPRALLPSPDSVTDGLAPMLAPPTMCDREGADALSVVLKLAEAGRRRLVERHTRCKHRPALACRCPTYSLPPPESPGLPCCVPARAPVLDTTACRRGRASERRQAARVATPLSWPHS